MESLFSTFNRNSNDVLSAEGQALTPQNVLDRVRDVALRVQPYEKGTDSRDDGKLYTGTGEEASLDNLKEMSKALSRSIRAVCEEHNFPRGVTYQGKLQRFDRVLTDPEAFSKLERAYPDQTDALHLARDLAQSVEDLTALRADMYIQKDMAMKEGLSKTGSLFGGNAVDAVKPLDL